MYYEYTDLERLNDTSDEMQEHFNIFFENEGYEIATEFYHREISDPIELLLEDEAFDKFAKEMFDEYLDRDPMGMFVC